MSKKNVITIEDILKRKEYFQSKKKETRELYIKSLDANIVIAKLDKELCSEVMELEGNEADEHMVYNSIISPNLKSQELQSQFELDTPYDILYAIFEPGEVRAIASQCLDFAGYTDGVTIVEEIKN